MKTLLLALTMIISTQTFAAKCVISGTVQDGSSCHSLSTRLDVSDAETCEAFTKATVENRFFNILEKKEKLLSSSYKFVDRPNRIKIKKTFEHESTDGCLF
jgi:methionine-rich copper-binding protein CopC